jgi:hypothetical protein
MQTSPKTVKLSKNVPTNNMLLFCCALHKTIFFYIKTAYISDFFVVAFIGDISLLQIYDIGSEFTLLHDLGCYFSLQYSWVKDVWLEALLTEGVID